jgi:hypothetical protein
MPRLPTENGSRRRYRVYKAGGGMEFYLRFFIQRYSIYSRCLWPVSDFKSPNAAQYHTILLAGACFHAAALTPSEVSPLTALAYSRASEDRNMISFNGKRINVANVYVWVF